MYRKPTHTNTVLNFKSHHPFSTKLGIAIGQFKRVKNICNNIKTLKEGEELIRTTLRNSNYPENIIDKAYVIANRGPKPYTSNEETTSNSIILRIPFINEFYTKIIKKKIKSIQFPFRICPIFYTQKRLSDLFIRSNLPSRPNQLTSENNTNMIIKPNCSFCSFCNNNTCICHQRNLICSLQCNICLKTCNNNINNDIKQGEYIGETSRHLIKRLNEHINAIKKNNINSSAMAAHYPNFHSGVKIDDRTFSVNLLHRPKYIGFMDRQNFRSILYY